MKKALLILIIMYSGMLYSQAPPPNGGGDPPCWPPETCETPINNELILLAVAGLIVVIKVNGYGSDRKQI